MDRILRPLEKFIPRKLYSFFQPAYHYLWALFSALVFRFPSRKITVIAVTGTKGKSSTVEILGAILEEAGYKVALTNTVRFKIGNESTDNKFKMSMPGRFFMQRFLRKAVSAGCQYAVIETTSEGARFFRHRFIALDALIFTNLSPEHIESHGSFEKYRDAKLSIAKALVRSSKKRKLIVVNADDAAASLFKTAGPQESHEFRLADATNLMVGKDDTTFTWQGAPMTSHLSGVFNVSNFLGAATCAKAFGVGLETIAAALGKFHGIRGRVERVNAGQDFEAIVDYAHTADSLTKLYEAFQESRKICVLGSTGGGRDKWKRKDMGAVAGRFCDEIILTNEDPYNEDPMAIIEDVKSGIKEKQVKVIPDRREAIRYALSLARTGDAVLITGKGTDPYIMGPNGTKLVWDDATVVREELEKVKSSRVA